MKKKWKEKLASRKFWVAVTGFVTPLLLTFGVSQAVVSEIAGIIMAGATFIAYIIAEGFVDSATKNTKGATINEDIFNEL